MPNALDGIKKSLTNLLVGSKDVLGLDIGAFAVKAVHFKEDAGQKKMETVLVAAKKELVTQRLEILQGCGLSPTIIDVDSFTLENVHGRLADPKGEAGSTLYLNIGHMVTNLSILEAGSTRVV